MTGVALIGAGDMGAGFAAGGGTVVATDAGTGNLGMVHIGGSHRHPTRRWRTMAGIALIRSGNMRGRTAAGGGAVMTTDAVTDDLTVIHIDHGHRNPAGRRRTVTPVAGIGGGDMGRRAAAGDDRIMATDTGADDLGMVHVRWLHRCPQGRRFAMTGIAGIARRNMRGGLAAGNHAIVTAQAITVETRMIHGGAQPLRGVMTHIACLDGRHMRLRLAGGDDAVVATAATADDLAMIHRRRRHRYPAHEIDMASFTNIGCGHMRRRLGRGANARGMAQHAIINDRQLVVGERRRQPGANIMAKIARCRGRNMIRRLSRRRGDRDHEITVTKSATGTGHLIVIHATRQRHPGYGSRCVTGCAVIGGRRMTGALAGGYGAIMTTGASTQHLAMINTRRRHRYPMGGQLVMTGLALITAVDMRGGLAAGIDAVMA